MDRANIAEAALAYLQTEGDFNHAAKGMPILKHKKAQQILTELTELESGWFMKRWLKKLWNGRRIETLKAEYQKRFHRDVSFDLEVFARASRFAHLIKELDSQKNPKSLERFFSSMGRATGFDYMKTIAALAKIAGESETIIHELLIKGGGICLAASDEGEILHPERDMTRYLAKLV